MKKSFSFLLSALMLVSLLSGCGGSNDDTTEGCREILVGASYTTATGYIWNTAASQVVNARSDIIKLSPISTTGSSENLLLIVSGETGMGSVGANNAWTAYTGHEEWTKNGYEPVEDLRVVWNNTPAYFHIMVPADSDINCVEDLRGKRVCMGVQGGGVAVNVSTWLGVLGILDDIEILYMNDTDAISALNEGGLDVLCSNTGTGSGNAMELASSAVGLKMISLSDEEIAKLEAELPYLHAGIIPAGTYPGVDYDTQTSRSTTIIASKEDLMTTDEVYEFCRLVNENIDELIAAYEPAGYSTAQTTYDDWNGIVPFHSGTEKYLRELGIMK